MSEHYDLLLGKWVKDDEKKKTSKSKTTTKKTPTKVTGDNWSSHWGDDWDDDDYYGYWGGYKKEPVDEKEEIEKLCKSDTIVFHMTDSTTTMLSQIYEGKGWDVYTKSSWNGLSKNAIHEIIKRHDRVVCLGHGTPYGLIGGNIGKDEVELLKGKKIFAIWCYAATFFKNNGFEGSGVFCTDNCPSEVEELDWAGIRDKLYTREYVLENITYYSKLLADIVEDALSGDQQKALDYVKTEYVKKFGHDGMTDFNTNTLQIV